MVALAMVIIGIGWGGNIPIHEVICASTFGRRHLGAVRGLGFPVTAAIAAATPLALASYFDAVGSYAGAFYFCAALWFVAFVLLLFVRRPPRPADPASEPAAHPAGRERPLVCMQSVGPAVRRGRRRRARWALPWASSFPS